MALKISTEADSGVIADYWMISHISRDLINMTGFISAQLFFNEACAIDGKEPLKTIQIMFDAKTNPFTPEARLQKNDDMIAEDFISSQNPELFRGAVKS